MSYLKALHSIRRFFSVGQFAVLLENSSERSEEHAHFRDLIVQWEDRITAMPKTYEQDGKGDDAVAHLHYFFGGCDWYITEKDMGERQIQAFGFVILNGDTECAELGYVSLEELTGLGVEFDLYWEAKPLRDVKRKHGIAT